MALSDRLTPMRSTSRSRRGCWATLDDMRDNSMKAHEPQSLSGVLLASVWVLLVLATASSALGQTSPRRTCLPVSERAGRDVGCWLLRSEPLGQLSHPAVF